ncbi:hypothetical protein PVAND_000147 [Polypedilum vanderplanki]|uniref:Uncharacterized protein n=1 Tax=Polypedilum vanderplanki TaxID=319348 RepID=A0A9J6BJH5_POLVA|nr:hypothetical protein PVAND_000147 [Polypedilum vanderplanki]
MKCFKNLLIFVLLISIGSIYSAPVEEGKKVYDYLKNEKLFEKLNFIRECEQENKPLCSALLDIAISFNERKFEFTKDENKIDENFCQNQLLKALPEKPSDATQPLLKSYNIAWFKDTLNKDKNLCNTECFALDYNDYSNKPKKVCIFIYNQYKFLETQNKKVENNELEKVTSANNVTSGEQTQQQKIAVAVNDSIKTTNPQVSQQQTSIKIESEAGGGSIDVVPAAQTNIKSTIPIASVNKNESEQQQTLDVEPKPQNNIDKQVTNVKEVSLDSEKEKIESASTSTVTSSKSEIAQNKDDTKTNGDLESELDDHKIFDGEGEGETQQTEKEQEIDMNGDLGDDDEEYSDTFARDNNRNDPNQKITQDQLNDIDGPDSDSMPHVQSVQFQEDPDSNFFTYLCITMFLSILLYILYHNRQKLLALLLEGRRGSRRSRERSRGGSKAAYSKLDCNLEEAITSKKSLSGKSMDIIY